MKTARSLSIFQIIIVTLIILSTLLFLICLAVGWNYYHLPASERSLNIYHHIFRPSGRVGLFAGIGAIALFISNVLYWIRKLLTHYHGLGSLRAWLQWHVFSGIIGSLFVA